MRILVTGSDGFIGKNLRIRLGEIKNIKVLEFTRKNSLDHLKTLVAKADFIVHLAGENRPITEEGFTNSNVFLTQSLCDIIKCQNRRIPLILSSSIQAELNNPYGKSKLAAELVVKNLSLENNTPVFIYRLLNVFGKWCKPHYNSVVATFCHQIANEQPIQIDNNDTMLRLVYIDDVITSFLQTINSSSEGINYNAATPEYSITLGELATQLYAFKNCRHNLLLEPVGSSLTRALYATYISYLPPTSFFYDIPVYKDNRGIFAEILKTPSYGQFSFFTAFPGVTRGDHYHHTKTEKFLVVKGNASFKFRNIITNETFEIITTDKKLQVVETIPGWAHNVTNIGSSQMIVMLWANEIFNRNTPDTINHKI